ncbi:MAG: fused MFS/spermidine synthase, partial [Pseudomonadota bacterium]
METPTETNTVPAPNSSPLRNLSVYLLFTASGAAALVYQVLWARWLGLIFGNTSTSVAIVLASFMLGLALGSYLIGKYLDRIKNPMRLYAYLELAIGLFAIVFPFLNGLTDNIFTLLVSTESPLLWSLGVRVLLAVALLIIPTTMMGATLPLLTEFFRRSPQHSNNWRVGILYAANTFGAALGTIIASFFLIELLGLSSTTLIAAMLNFIVAYIGLSYARIVLPVSASTEKVSAPVPKLDTEGKLALGVLAASGAIALAMEVLWTRALGILIGNSTYAFALILVVYLTGIALGSWLMSLWVKKIKSLPLWLSWTQLGMGLWALLAIVLFAQLSDHLKDYAGQDISMGTLLWHYLKAASLLFPLALISGAVFPIATRILSRSFFKTVKHSNVVEDIIENFKYAMISGEFKPGQRLPSESELGQQLGVGRSSLREAIKIPSPRRTSSAPNA